MIVRGTADVTHGGPSVVTPRDNSDVSSWTNVRLRLWCVGPKSHGYDEDTAWNEKSECPLLELCFRYTIGRVLVRALGVGGAMSCLKRACTPHSPQEWTASRRTSICGDQHYLLTHPEIEGTFRDRDIVLVFPQQATHSSVTFAQTFGSNGRRDTTPTSSVAFKEELSTEWLGLVLSWWQHRRGVKWRHRCCWIW